MVRICTLEVWVRRSLPSGIEIEGVLLVARRVVGGRVEGIETMELVSISGPSAREKPMRRRMADGFIADQRERMQRAVSLPFLPR
jgi:hypothetical protein